MILCKYWHRHHLLTLSNRKQKCFKSDSLSITLTWHKLNPRDRLVLILVNETDDKCHDFTIILILNIVIIIVMKSNKDEWGKTLFATNLRQAIWWHIWKYTLEKSQTNATSVTLHPLILALWGLIWKYTVEKNQTNAANVTLHLLGQEIWGYIWKHTVEKSQTNATNVTLPLLKQAIWGHIWKHTVERSQTNAINATLHLLMHVLWRIIWKRTVEKGQTNAVSVIMYPRR